MLAFASLVFLPLASAALAGAAVENCHTSGFDCITSTASNKRVCHVGNLDLYQVGIVNTSISWADNQHPTWTQGLTNTRGIGIDNLTDYGQHWMLGMPPANSTFGKQFSGCALFFNVSALAISDPKQRYSAECSAYIGNQCQNDLMSQMTKLVGSNAQVDCAGLATKLNTAAPASCTSGTSGGSWGGIQAADFSSSSQILDQSQCMATTGRGYSIIDVFNDFPAQDVQITYLHMVMPIMTFLWTLGSTGSTTVGPILSDFSCVEIKYDGELSLPAGVSGASAIGPRNWSLMMLSWLALGLIYLELI